MTQPDSSAPIGLRQGPQPFRGERGLGAAVSPQGKSNGALLQKGCCVIADLPLDPPFFESTAFAVNNLGHVAGTFNPSAGGVPSSQWAFCWDGVEFRIIPPVGGLGVAAASGINDFGAVVGTMTHPESGILEAFVWQDGKTVIIGPFEIERAGPATSTISGRSLGTWVRVIR